MIEPNKEQLKKAIAAEKKVSPINQWALLVQGIVRPPKNEYQLNHLGSERFEYEGRKFARIDHCILHQQKCLEVSVFYCDKNYDFLIIYLHGNTSNRLEGIQLLKFIPERFALACFDFIGCGNNQQAQTISLGFRESQQTATIVQYFRKQELRIILWGRSMGAATALLNGKAEIIVADSAYTTFKSLCLQVSHNYSPSWIPNCCISCLFNCVFIKLEKDVKNRADYDIKALNISEAVERINPSTVLILLSGNRDELINHRNSQRLLKKFRGQKKYLYIFEGTHNSRRPNEIIQKVFQNILSQISTKAARISNQQAMIQMSSLSKSHKFNPLK